MHAPYLPKPPGNVEKKVTPVPQKNRGGPFNKVVFLGKWLTIMDVNELPPSLDTNAAPDAAFHNAVKRAIILDQEDEAYGVEYDNTIGSRNTMRLEATTYEDAILETKSFLGITENRDEGGTVWEID
jgi:hypothetical protein